MIEQDECESLLSDRISYVPNTAQSKIKEEDRSKFTFLLN